MNEFDFVVIRSGTLCCIDSASEDFYVLKKVAAKFVPITENGVDLVIGTTNTCVNLKSSGDYKVIINTTECSDASIKFEYKEESCCEDFSKNRIITRRVCVKDNDDKHIWANAVIAVGEDGSEIIRIEDDSANVINAVIEDDERKCPCF